MSLSWLRIDSVSYRSAWRRWLVQSFLPTRSRRVRLHGDRREECSSSDP